MAINCGRLKKHVEIWRYVSRENSMGSTVNKLEKIKTVYAEIRPVRGTEYTEYYKEMHEMSVKITMRYRADLKLTDVLVYHGQQYEIKSIINPEMANYILEVMCTERHEKNKPEDL